MRIERYTIVLSFLIVAPVDPQRTVFVNMQGLRAAAQHFNKAEPAWMPYFTTPQGAVRYASYTNHAEGHKVPAYMAIECPVPLINHLKERWPLPFFIAPSLQQEARTAYYNGLRYLDRWSRLNNNLAPYVFGRDMASRRLLEDHRQTPREIYRRLLLHLCAPFQAQNVTLLVGEMRASIHGRSLTVTTS